MKKICHITTVHRRYDKRIFEKECNCLSSCYDVNLIVADGLGDEIRNGIYIYDVGKSRNRFLRMLNSRKRAIKQAVRIDADLYHIHDPELWPVALKLKKLKKVVIFDAHEDFPNDLFNAHYLNDNFIKRLCTKYLLIPLLRCYQRYVFRRLDALIAATPYIKTCIQNLNRTTIIVYNYFDTKNLPTKTDKINVPINNLPGYHYLIFGGTIDESNGCTEMVQALKFTNNVILRLCGQFSSEKYKAFLQNLPEWRCVEFFGWMTHKDMANVYEKSDIGIVLCKSKYNSPHALPIKLFEFMYYGLPVIGSTLPGIRSVVEKSCCGICVDPYLSKTPKEIARCINELISKPAVAKLMGENGRKAVLNHYNMTQSYKVLLDLYKQLLKE